MAHYHPVRCLHQQAEAEIFLCLDRTTRKLVVVKTIAHGGFPSTRDDGNVEATIVAKLQQLRAHPHVVHYTSVVWEQDATRITMEHCSHGDLLGWLEEQPHHRFKEVIALSIFTQVLRGVRYLHRHGIAHRDLSLENLLVGNDRVIKICDFGCATTYAHRLCRQIVGKPQYMAPEIVAGDWYDPVRADVWSLGIVLFILLTGCPLFALADASDAIFRAFASLGVAGVLRHWQMDHRISGATQELLMQMLSVDPSKRCPSIGQLLERLQ